MKKILKSLLKLGLSVSVFGLALNLLSACDSHDYDNNEVTVEDNGYTFHSTYEENEKNIKIEIYDDGESVEIFDFPYYGNLEEYKDTGSVDELPLVTETKTGFGYYPQGDYWEYICPQALVDIGVVDFREISVDLNKAVPIQEMFEKKLEAAISLEDELEKGSKDKMEGLLIAIPQALTTYIEPDFFTGVAISYFESLGYEYDSDGIEAEYIEVNKDLVELFVRLENNKYVDE